MQHWSLSSQSHLLAPCLCAWCQQGLILSGWGTLYEASGLAPTGDKCCSSLPNPHYWEEVSRGAGFWLSPHSPTLADCSPPSPMEVKDKEASSDWYGHLLRSCSWRCGGFRSQCGMSGHLMNCWVASELISQGIQQCTWLCPGGSASGSGSEGD